MGFHGLLHICNIILIGIFLVPVPVTLKGQTERPKTEISDTLTADRGKKETVAAVDTVTMQVSDTLKA